MSELQLVKKLAKVMKEVQYIQKRGFNKFNNYNYATESDVQEKVREVLAEQNVIMLPDVIEHTTREHTNRKGYTEYIATVKVKFTFIDGDTGENLSIHSSGEGQDAGDKAVYKAITGAQKYALMKAFIIPTGDDPEADNGVDERNNEQQTPQKKQESITDPQRKTIEKLLKSKVNEKYSYDDLVGHLQSKVGTKQPIEKWTKNQASKALNILNEQKAG